MRELVQMVPEVILAASILLILGLAAAAGGRAWRKRSSSSEARVQLQEFPGLIVFDSNRSGRFAIYALSPKGAEQSSKPERPIIESDTHCMFPDPSPCGTKIVFAKTDSPDRTARSEIWIADADGSNQRKLTDDGTFPTFSADGATIYFERGRKAVIAMDLDGGNQHEIFPCSDPNFGSKQFQIAKPRVSADGSLVFFTSDKHGRWNAFYADLSAGMSYHLHKGCEPAPFHRSRNAAWVNKRHYFARSGIKQIDLQSGAIAELPESGTAEGHEYFPSVVGEDRFLLYSASSNRNPAHDSSNYQIYLRDLRTGASTRVTFDGFTNRWPKLLRTANQR